jgi:acetolactate synthase-1/2/3 large subunit
MRRRDIPIRMETGVSARTTIAVDTVAEAYLSLLAARGIEYLLANGGTDFAPVIEGLAAINAKGRTPRLNVVPVAHENVAAAMAHGYYLMTGRPAAVMFHVSVGTANGINELLNAARDQVPMLFTAGRTPLSEFGQRGSRDTGIHWGQEMFDQAAMVREACKWDYELRNGDQLEDVVDRALEIATSEPCGPVYLSLPREVLSAPMQTFSFASPPRRASRTVPGPDPDAIARAADILARAERPVIFSRAGGRVAASASALAEFAERFALPLVEFRVLTNAVPSNHPMLIGFQPPPHLQEADVILNIESDVPWIPTVHGQPAEDCRLIHLGVDPLYARLPIRSFRCDVAVTGAPATALPALSAALDGRMGAKKMAARRKRIAESRERARKDVKATLARVDKLTPISPDWASHCVAQAAGDQAIYVNEYPLLRQHVPVAQPRSLFNPGGAGGLGWGLGAAIGMKIAAPERLVVAALGDGAYMFGNPTAGHQVLRNLGLPVLFVIFNNAMWEEVERATLMVFPEGHAARANQVPVAHLGPAADFQHMMAIYGGYGERVDRPEELPAALGRALHAVKVEGRQALLNVIVGRRGVQP